MSSFPAHRLRRSLTNSTVAQEPAQEPAQAPGTRCCPPPSCKFHESKRRSHTEQQALVHGSMHPHLGCTTHSWAGRDGQVCCTGMPRLGCSFVFQISKGRFHTSHGTFHICKLVLEGGDLALGGCCRAEGPDGGEVLRKTLTRSKPTNN
jgi:hypothetical protein